jgi:chloramphenicol-sensitive protein RarD
MLTEMESLPLKWQARHARGERAVGLVYALLAYGAWGLVPLYFRQVRQVSAHNVLAHRVVWSVVFLALLITVQRRWRDVVVVLKQRRTMLMLLGSTTLVAINWLTFIWAVAHQHVLQSSIGYFMNPLVNVILGVLLLKERLRAWQAIALALAAAGVTIKASHGGGSLLWISFTLAISFGGYGLLRKTMPVGPLVGSMVETAILFPIGAALVAMQVSSELSHVGTLDAKTYGWLLCAGVITAVPLLWFAAGARRLRLSTMGFLQYLSPTGQFLLAVFAFGEPLRRADLLAFALIWIALAVYSVDAWRAYRLTVVPMPE